MTDNSNKMSPYFEVAMDVAEVVKQKQEAYGNSFGKAGLILNIFYPAGIPVDCLDDALTIVRIVDKLFRIANQKNAFGENPYADIAGYSLLAIVRDQMKHPKTENVHGLE